jgi:hypothetical protein
MNFGETELEGASALICHEERDSQRYLCGFYADDVPEFSCDFHVELGGLQVRDRLSLLVGH